MGFMVPFWASTRLGLGAGGLSEGGSLKRSCEGSESRMPQPETLSFVV